MIMTWRFFSECNVAVPPPAAPENTKNPISTSVLESSQQQNSFLDPQNLQNQKNPSPLSSDQQSPPLNQLSPSMVSQNI